MYRRLPPGRLRRIVYSRELQRLRALDYPTMNTSVNDIYILYGDYINYMEEGDGYNTYDNNYDRRARFTSEIGVDDHNNYYDDNGLINTSNVRESYGLPPLEVENNENTEDISTFSNDRGLVQELVRDDIDFEPDFFYNDESNANVSIGFSEEPAHTVIDIPNLNINDILNTIEYGVSDSYENLSLLEDVKVGLISEKILKNTIVRNSESLGFCIICQEDIFLCVERELKCKHRFHINCIDTWFTNNNKCPTCRTEI